MSEPVTTPGTAAEGAVVPGTRIRATHPYAYRSGEWALLTGTMTHPENGRECYAVIFDDGATDWWLVGDKSHGYEFRDPP